LTKRCINLRSDSIKAATATAVVLLRTTSETILKKLPQEKLLWLFKPTFIQNFALEILVYYRETKIMLYLTKN